ncbi:MAG: DUF1559 domain-containing protein [Gemmataceae bacterium]
MTTVSGRGTGEPRRPGFTLVELLVVLAIVGVVLALCLAAVQRARAVAARAACASNLRQLALALHQYEQHHGGSFPAGCGYPLPSPGTRVLYAPVSWHTSILPFVEQQELARQAWDAYRADPLIIGTVEHQRISTTVVPVFLCPAESRRIGGYEDVGFLWALQSYVGVAGTALRENDGIFHPDFRVRLTDVTDGTSNTLMIGERPPGPLGRHGAWYMRWNGTICPGGQILPAWPASQFPSGAVNCPLEAPVLRPGRPDDACDLTHFWSLHPGGATFALVDGSVRFITDRSAATVPLLATRAGGERLPADW